MASRDKESTKQKIIDAVRTIVLNSGFQALGINAIAKQAGVDKVLIYRYFGNLDGLIKAFVSEKDFYINLDEQLEQAKQLKSISETGELLKQVFLQQLRQTRANREMQEVLLWELSEKNEVTESIARAREQQGLALISQLQTVFDFSKTDIPALGNILIGGINYLILRSRTVDVYSGVDLASDEGWQRLENAVSQLIDLIMQNVKE